MAAKPVSGCIDDALVSPSEQRVGERAAILATILLGAVFAIAGRRRHTGDGPSEM
jgi:hypothetical protein